MNIRDFAARHRLKVAKDGSGEDIEFVIQGRVGQSLIYEYSDTDLAVAFVTDGKKPPRTGLYNTFKAACLSAGMTLRQSGDAEGSFSFDPENDAQAKATIRLIRAKAKRRISPEQALAGAARLLAARQASQTVGNPHVERLDSA
jgi:predicted DNA-binding WGR domain protein